MEPEFKVFSMLADVVVFTGTKAECEDYKKINEHGDDSLYILKSI